MSREHERRERLERRERPGAMAQVIAALFLIAMIGGAVVFVVWRLDRAWAATSTATRGRLGLALWGVIGLGLLWLGVSMVYSFWRRWQRDNLDLEAERLARVGYWRAQLEAMTPDRFEKMPTDDHGLLGAVLDRATGHFLNLDTGHVLSAKTERAGDPDLVQIAARGKTMAALTGVSVQARQVVQELGTGTTDTELRFTPMIEEPKHEDGVIEL